MVTRVKNLSGRRAYLALGLVLASVASVALAATFNLFGPVNGILKGNANSPQTSAAASSDVIALWSGTCNGSSALKGDGSCGTLAAGTVSSVGLTMPTGFSVSGSPVTTSGTLGVTTALNGPVRGNGSGFITGTTSLTTEVSGILPVANGGTGVGTLTGIAKGNGTSVFTAAASSDITGTFSGTCNSSTFLRGDGSCQSPGGGGTVTSVAMSVPAFLSVSGSPVTNSGTLAVSLSGTALPVLNGGTGTTTSTGSGNVVLSASPTLTGTTTAATVAATAVTVGGNNVCQSTGTNCPAAGASLSGANTWTNTNNFTAGLSVSGITVLNVQSQAAAQVFAAGGCGASPSNISACTRNATGNYSITLSPGLSNGRCMVSYDQDSFPATAAVPMVHTTSFTNVNVRWMTTAAAAVDVPFNIICQ